MTSIPLYEYIHTWDTIAGVEPGASGSLLFREFYEQEHMGLYTLAISV